MSDDISGAGPGGAGPERPVSGPGGPPTPPSEMHPGDQRNLSLVAHLGGFLGVFWIGWLPALVIYLTRARRGAFVRAHSREALNFQLTMVVAYLGVGLVDRRLDLPLSWPTVLWVGNLVLIALASRAASSGKTYRYPVAVRLLR